MENENQVKIQTADGERLLTEAETKRYRNLLAKQAELESKGYVRTDRTISIAKANTVGILAVAPFVILVVGLYILRNSINFSLPGRPIEGDTLAPLWFLITFVVTMGFMVVHELIHGLFWSFGAEHGWKDIEFGFIVKLLTPYCTCLSPVKKPVYILGSMMPMTLIGILSGVLAIFTANPFILFFSAIHIFGGAGDILISGKMLKDRVEGKDVLILDHPYDCGYILFEKK